MAVDKRGEEREEGFGLGGESATNRRDGREEEGNTLFLYQGEGIKVKYSLSLVHLARKL